MTFWTFLCFTWNGHVWYMNPLGFQAHNVVEVYRLWWSIEGKCNIFTIFPQWYDWPSERNGSEIQGSCFFFQCADECCRKQPQTLGDISAAFHSDQTSKFSLLPVVLFLSWHARHATAFHSLYQIYPAWRGFCVLSR